ncbi:hypothetical protein B843_07165 [Corynebacterium vitaeruminis DSM 20294]|uniref:Uncharacterized protein n=1 Tax=Corynebacterium vitaeruminis DSM 20294 TaxID=1224164 RepID=W5Y8J8_9CORY|nr:hypothetical protein B843_07165 [Corynebacterium vitaeruminis DSM 20294]
MVNIPVAIRVGGAFMAIAVVLFIFTAIEIFTKGWMTPFEVNTRFLLIVVAAAVLGAFATVNRNQAPSAVQVGALAVALLLVVAGRFLPNPTLATWEQYWLPGYAVLALLCGLVIRRAMTPKA